VACTVSAAISPEHSTSATSLGRGSTSGRGLGRPSVEGRRSPTRRRRRTFTARSCDCAPAGEISACCIDLRARTSSLAPAAVGAHDGLQRVDQAGHLAHALAADERVLLVAAAFERQRHRGQRHLLLRVQVAVPSATARRTPRRVR
jgi:hypothetical protein